MINLLRLRRSSPNPDKPLINLTEQHDLLDVLVYAAMDFTVPDCCAFSATEWVRCWYVRDWPRVVGQVHWRKLLNFAGDVRLSLFMNPLPPALVARQLEGSHRGHARADDDPDNRAAGFQRLQRAVGGQLGLPFAFANHFDTGGTLAALDVYRQSLTPSTALEQPYAIVTANVLVADTDDEATFLAGQLLLYGIRTGRFISLMTPNEPTQHLELSAAHHMRSNSILGSPDATADSLNKLVQETAADDIMVTTFAQSRHSRTASMRGRGACNCWRRRGSTPASQPHRKRHLSTAQPKH